jgi:hypothetical protein
MNRYVYPPKKRADFDVFSGGGPTLFDKGARFVKKWFTRGPDELFVCNTLARSKRPEVRYCTRSAMTLLSDNVASIARASARNPQFVGNNCIPEPSSIVYLTTTGLLGLFAYARRRRRKT